MGYNHVIGPDGKVERHWFEAERSSHAVGGAQKEDAAEKQSAMARNKATASVIGIRAMGTRFNVLATVQVPLKQTQRPVASPWLGGGYGAAPMMAMAASSGMLGQPMVASASAESYQEPAQFKSLSADEPMMDSSTRSLQKSYTRPVGQANA